MRHGGDPGVRSDVTCWRMVYGGWGTPSSEESDRSLSRAMLVLTKFEAVACVRSVDALCVFSPRHT